MKLTQANLNNIPIQLPPIDLQRKFTNIVNKIEGNKLKQGSSLRKIEQFLQTLQQKAFKGELFNDEFPPVEPQEEKVWQQTPLF